MTLSDNLFDLLESGRHKLSTIKPSQWAEKNRSMDGSVSRFKGPFRFDVTPYTREIVDTLSPEHPARIVAIMKGAQIGYSTSVIENGIGWIIAEQPGNILFLTGHSDLSEEAVAKVDNMIDSCGIRHLIKSSVKRARSMKTGDTNTKKEFPGGSLVTGSAGNHKMLRQRSVMYGFIDDFDAARTSTKQSGSTTKMIEARFASYADRMKLFYISTPELKETSNIEPVYLLGDQRRYHVPCPCCGELIFLEWSIQVEGTEERAGIFWKLDGNNKLIEDSVGYVCQKCGGFFKDTNKHEMNLHGMWKPTAEPSREGYYSYHVSSLYAPVGMYDWNHYVRQYLEANPPNQPTNEALQKTFLNLCLGLTYEAPGESPKASDLMKNIRPYEVGIIPEKMSIADGNGTIVLLTMAIDMNGTEDDARLDYEVVAWSESGASYSIIHGSIGTFVPREGNKKNKEDRMKWTYEHNHSNSVWPELKRLINEVYITDTGRSIKVFISGLDTGHYTQFAYSFLDNVNNFVVGIKGDKEEKYIPLQNDIKTFKPAMERPNLYILTVGKIKDELATYINLNWDKDNDNIQPFGYMNYPTPSRGLYLFNNFFSHYESEHRVSEIKDGKTLASKWVKKNSTVQNHLFDCRVYNIAIRNILVAKVCKELKIVNYTWTDFVDVVMGRSEYAK